MDYMTLKEAGQKWNVTPRQVNYLCSGGRIPGAVKMAGVWLIPKNAEKPIDGRTKQGKGLHHHDIRMNCFPSSFSKYLVFKNLIPVPKTLLGSY